MVDHHRIGVLTVAGFDLLVCANQIHVPPVDAVVFNEWMGVGDRLRFLPRSWVWMVRNFVRDP